jgi:CheY-like chemotaxis protein
MDMRMPVMDGYTATREIRALPGGEAVKIVAVTASALEEQHEEILACGCDDLVCKPFRDQEIFGAMATQLGIKYRYKAGLVVPRKPLEINLTAEMLATLPKELLQELDLTTLTLDREAIFAVIERIDDEDPETAEALRALMDNFQTARIRALLKETERQNGS